MPYPIRVLHVIRLMNHGGVESMIMNLYRNIDRTKVQFDFVQNSNEPAVYDEEILSLGGKIYHCPHYNVKNHFEYTRWWHDFFKSHPGEYPIIHGHLVSTSSIYLRVAKKYGSFTIAHSHSTGASLAFRLFTYPTRFIADHLFACSAEAAVSRFGKRMAKDVGRCKVIKNAIDTEHFIYDTQKRKEMRARLEIAPNALVIGHVGQFREEKNHAFLLDIFQAIHEKRNNSVLLLVGDGDLRSQIETIIAEKGLRDCVIMAGSQSNVCDYYQAMDVFVMPSLYEGLPLALVEAQTAGLPCLVSTNVPSESALTDLVSFLSLKDGVLCWCDQVIKNGEMPRRNKLQDIIEKGFDIKESTKRLEDFYLKTVIRNG